MLVLHPFTFRGLSVLAALLAATSTTAEFFEWTESYIPYNSDNADLYGESFQGKRPYTMTDPLRQHLHVYQNPSDKPTPVCFLSHSNGSSAVGIDGAKSVVDAGYSVISWESVTSTSEKNTQTCLDDFELVWSWFKANAKKYNFDPDSVIISGRSRGTICSWFLGVSGKPEVKGLFMINALPDPGWVPAAKKGPGYIWDQAITVNSPPALLLFMPECPKPIGQDCVPSPTASDWHNPSHGQTIVDRYIELGIGSRIQLTDGLTNNNIHPFSLFQDFVTSLSSSSDSSLDSSTTDEGSSSTNSVGGDSSLATVTSSNEKAAGSQIGNSFPASTSSIGGDSSLATVTLSNEATASSQMGTSFPTSTSSVGGDSSFTTVISANEATAGSQMGTSSAGEGSSSISSVGGDSSFTTVTSFNEAEAVEAVPGRNFFLDVMIISFCGFCASFGYNYYLQLRKYSRDQTVYTKVVYDGELDMQDMDKSSYRDDPEHLA